MRKVQVCLAILVLAANGVVRANHAPALTSGVSWSVNVLDRILAAAPPGERLVQVGDMRIRSSDLRVWRNQLAGLPQPQLAFDGTSPLWVGGNVFYAFDSSISSAHRKAFLDGAAEWATFANLHFVARTAEPNFVTIRENAALNGGQSAVGMVGGEQFLEIGPSAWNRPTIVHELGHTLGLVHEHQRSDRDNYVLIMTNNILPGEEGNFVLLTDSRNQGAYDFLSVMHYNKNSFAIDPTQPDILPRPPFVQFLDIMGQRFDPVLSAADRGGMAALYGAGPGAGPVVTNTLDSGPGSLRAAFYFAFDHPGTTITFNLSTNDPGFSNLVFTIQPTDVLPSLVNATVVDGHTQPMNLNPNGPAIQLNGAQAPPPSVFPNGLVLRGTNCTVRALIINGFAASGILIDGTNATGNVVSGCYLGLDATGNSAVTNGFTPLTIANGAHGNLIGGITIADRNILSGSAYQGLVIRDPDTRNNTIEGNYIGLNAAGAAALPNAWSGVAIFNGAQSNVVGGSVAGGRNVIAGNTFQGVAISDTNTTRNQIAGNYIGLNPGGTAAIPNGWAGVDIFGGAQANLVGGNSPTDRNIISGNGTQGIAISGPGTTDNAVCGNFIGLAASGSFAIGNTWSGVQIFNQARNNQIGGATVGVGNVISGNLNHGATASDPGTGGNLIQGNFIGVDPAGTVAIGNGWAGVVLFGGTDGNTIGGGAPGSRNIISGNGNQGIVIADNNTTANAVQGNFIGLDATGSFGISNTWSGVDVFNGATGNAIGGAPGGRNFISGNGGDGLRISGFSTLNIVQGNTIGLNAFGSLAVPNANSGVDLFNGAAGNLIGGTAPGAANLIAYNLNYGVSLFDATTSNNVVRGNSVFSNAWDTLVLYSGANAGAVPPVLASAVLTTNTTVSGTLNSSPNTAFHLDFYASPAPLTVPQARTYLGGRDVLTEPGGAATFVENLGGIVPAGQVITATATDSTGNTSALSSGVVVTSTDSVGDGIPDAWRSAHFGGSGTSTNSLSCATCDPDQDGLNNWQEFVAGTDPNNAGSALRISGLARLGGDMVVSFQSVSGITYRLDVRGASDWGYWSPLADQVLGTGELIQIAEPGAAALPEGYYRLEVLR